MCLHTAAVSLVLCLLRFAHLNAWRAKDACTTPLQQQLGHVDAGCWCLCCLSVAIEHPGAGCLRLLTLPIGTECGIVCFGAGICSACPDRGGRREGGEGNKCRRKQWNSAAPLMWHLALDALWYVPTNMYLDQEQVCRVSKHNFLLHGPLCVWVGG